MSDRTPRAPDATSVRQKLWRATHRGAVEDESGLEPRAVAPSERMLALGLADQPPPVEMRVAREAEERSRIALRERLRGFMHEYRPSRVTGGLTVTPLLVIASVSFVTAMQSAGLGTLLFFMREDLGFDVRFIISIGTIIATVETVIAPLIGFLVDRVKRVRLAMVGVAGFGLSAVLTGFASSAVQLGILRGSGSLVSSVNDPTHQPLLADYYPPTSRGRVFAFSGSLAGQAGLILGPILAGGIGQLFGWRAAFWAVGSLAILSAGGFLLLREPVRGGVDRIAAGGEAEREGVEPPPPPGLVESWRACASIVTLRRLWYAEPFLAFSGIAIYTLLLAFQVEAFSLSPALLGLFAAVNAGMGMGGTLVGAPLVDRFLAYRPGRVLVYVGVLLIIDIFLFIAIVTTPFIPLAIALSFSLPFVNAIVQPARATLMTMVIPARIRGIGLQTNAPWKLVGFLAFLLFGSVVATQGAKAGLLIFVPLFIVGAILHIAAAAGVDRDIRAANAANLADLESRESRKRGRGKLLVVRDLDVHYDGVQILFGVDFDVEEGEIVALLGTNGAGKSTLLRAVSGLTEASNGAVFLDGRDITHTPPYEIAARRVVQMPGGRGIFPTLTVEENLRAATWLSEDEPAFLEEQIARVLDEFFPALRERLHEPAGALSGGEQQMLALGQAFIMRPRLLLIDELSLGLAPAIVQQLIAIVKEFRSAGSTVILVEQSVNLALTVADRAVFMEKGEVRFSGPTADLMARPDILRSVYLRTATKRGGGGLGLGPRGATAEDASGAVVLEASDIRVRFGGIDALRGVSLQARSGEILGVIGSNGAGKTTLFDVVSGFVVPVLGMVTVAGKDVTALGPDQRAKLGLGRSFQDARLFGSLTVRENIEVALERHLDSRSALLSAVWAPRARRSEQRAQRRADHLVDLLGLGDYADKFVGELSTGSRRIVDIACTMAADPDVLLLDEPSSGIAQAETEELGPLLRRVRRETGCALVVIEHDMRLITGLADRLVAMHLGEVIAEGSPADVVADPKVVEAYLGADEDEPVSGKGG